MDKLPEIENIYRANLLALFLGPNVSVSEPFPIIDIGSNKDTKDNTSTSTG